MENGYDFIGWATRNDQKCSDGRIIRRNAFADCDGKVVPLVWNHNHDDPRCVLGHGLLKNHEEGVRVYGKFNDTSSGESALRCVKNGDITALSIYANQLTQTPSGDVMHGNIREVSLVLAGANPGAVIDDVIVHADYEDCEAFIRNGDADIEFYHADKEEDTQVADTKENSTAKKSNDEMTVEDVFNTLDERQKTVVYALIGEALNQANGGSDDSEEEPDTKKKKTTTDGSEEEDTVKHNVFESDTKDNSLKHADEALISTAIADAKRYGSMRDSFLAHGITDIEWLFPEDRTLDVPPRIIDNDQGWVSTVMNGVHHVPFSRFKSMFADLTEDDARAKGYIKGNFKKEQVFSLLKRSTAPTTVYKKQRMDRDDIIDITSFDVVAWLKSEMRTKLNEELARAILIGDGRLASSDDKINEGCIRPIYNDDDLFTIKCQVAVKSADDTDTRTKATIRAIIKSRKDYKGSGNPTFFTSEDMLTDMLLLEDEMGRPMYADEAALARKLRVNRIVTVPQMENFNGSKGGAFIGLIVNLSDYTVGADKGGAVNTFDDFDINYNQQVYLIETRCSGALTVPYSAIAVEYSVT